jgi:hypothetical protein
MAIPTTETPPSPVRQLDIISKANYQELEKARQHALMAMQALTQGKSRIPSGYGVWSFFVGKIEAEQRRRAARA